MWSNGPESERARRRIVRVCGVLAQPTSTVSPPQAALARHAAGSDVLRVVPARAGLLGPLDGEHRARARVAALERLRRYRARARVVARVRGEGGSCGTVDTEAAAPRFWHARGEGTQCGGMQGPGLGLFLDVNKCHTSS